MQFVKEKDRTASVRFKLLFPFVALGGLVVTAVMALVLVFIVTAWWGQPIPILGFEQSPVQPIAYPHTAHAGTVILTNADGTHRLDNNGQPLKGMGLDCTFCHRTVTTSAAASVPSVQQCMFCHQVVGPDSPDNRQEPLDILRRSGGIADLTKDAGGAVVLSSPAPIAAPVNWKRVHRMPDHVRFVHDTHVRFLMANPDAILNVPPQNQSSVQTAVQSNGQVVPAMVCSTCHGDVANMPQVQQVQPLKMGQCVNCHRDNNAPTDCAVCHY